MSTAGGIVIAIFVLLIAAAVGWVVFTQLRARRLGVRFDCSFLQPLDSLVPPVSGHCILSYAPGPQSHHADLIL